MIDLDDHEAFLARRPPTQGLSVAPWYAALVERYRAVLTALREKEQLAAVRQLELLDFAAGEKEASGP